MRSAHRWATSSGCRARRQAHDAPEKVPNGPIVGLFVDPQGHTIGVADPDM
jgi:hypothetical protein